MSELSKLESDHQALHALFADAKLLTALEARASQFNLFEAIGMDHQEIRHSKFLAYLLDPNGNHGFGDHFLKAFLAEITGAEGVAFIDGAESREIEVVRERFNIDILIIDHSQRKVVAIENKIYAGVHSDQLDRYHNLLTKIYSGYTPLFVFLSLRGYKAGHDLFPFPICR